MSAADNEFNFDLGFSSRVEQTREWVEPNREQLPPIAARNARETGTDLVSYLAESFGFSAFVLYSAIFLFPMGPQAYGPGVNIGWPPRFAFFTYMLWVVTLAWQGIRCSRPDRAAR